MSFLTTHRLPAQLPIHHALVVLSRRWTIVLAVAAMILPTTLAASADQVVDFTDLTRQTAGYHVDTINPGAPTPWGVSFYWVFCWWGWRRWGWRR